VRKRQKPPDPDAGAIADPRGPAAACPVVGMGASAGGLDAFQKFFTHLPPDPGMAFVLALHLDPRQGTMLPHLLGRVTSMPVEEARDGVRVRADHVYVIPPNAVLTLEEGHLRVSRPRPAGVIPAPIDALFHSLALDQGAAAVCIVLSGAGSDGTFGLRAVKEQGGIAFAQTPESAQHDSLLRSAIATGLVDHVLPPEAMPERLLAYAAYLRNSTTSAALLAEAGEHLARIYEYLRRKTGHDFAGYKKATVVRRIQRRLQVLQLPSFAAYADRLSKDKKEVEALFRDLLIGVTHFFRDPEAFEALAREVLPRLVREAAPHGQLRIWTPGCATGEEAYTAAMLVQEEMERQDLDLRVQIFAGDIDEESLEAARLGRYPEGIARHVTPERLARFFYQEDGCYRVTKRVREMCVFSTHSLIKDPPFSRIDLLVCRNLLIYLEAELQRQVATLFHYSLRSGGYLFLGPSESLLSPPDLFRTVDKKHRIFERKESVARPALALPPSGAKPARGGRAWVPRIVSAGQGEIVGRLERLLLDSFAPAWVVVNAQGESIYFSPRTGRYLEAPPGHPSMDVVSMARKGLRLDLRTALHKAVRTGEVVTHEGVEVPTAGEVQHINVIVRPLRDIEEDSGLYLIVFQELGRAAVHLAAPGHTVEDDRIVQLESELRMTKEHLQATVEEVETANEELKSSNEELLSSNEELQSANEELQTAKEELQSVNEELETINGELTQKVEELDLVNNDLQNLLQNTQIPTLFLDHALRIKRFTNAATALFRLIPTDAGRPITDITQRFDGDIVPDLSEVLRTGTPRERRVQVADGTATYIMRTMPYRRIDSVMDGLVVAFLDVTQLESALERSARLAAIVESSQDAIVSWTPAGEITAWNAGATRLLGFSEEEAVGQPISLIATDDHVPDALERYRAVEEAPPAPFETTLRTKDGPTVTVSVSLAPIKEDSGGVTAISSIFRDISPLAQARESLRLEAQHKDDFLSQLSHELRNPLAPLRTCLDVLRADPPARQKESSLQIMDRQLGHLTALVDQLLDASRIASGKIQLHREPLDLVTTVRQAVGDQRAVLERNGLTLRASLPRTPLPIHGDRVRLAQVIANLLGNAAKFTPRGGIVQLALTRDRLHAVLTLRDNGVGIHSDALPRLFQPFAQAANLPPETRTGLGLGLAVVKALVVSHGGTVEASSDGEGLGAEFVVRLPLAPKARAVGAGKAR
jgi:two-component system, chemotaxis family, CheB/CheR fusion protein